MAQIQLDPDYSPIRLAVKNNYVYLRVTGGWNLTNLKDKDKNVDYDEIKQTYTFNFYTNSGKTTKIIEKTGATNNNGRIDVVLYGLTKGTKNNVTVSISYSYKVRYWKSSSDPITGVDTSNWGDWETKTNSSLNRGSLYVYTRNDRTSTEFWGNPSSGNYIDQHITSYNVGQWIQQLGIWNSWYTQTNNYASNSSGVWTVTSNGYTITQPSSGYKVDISSNWYNNCVKACRKNNTVIGLSEVIDKTQATYISANHFINLAKYVTDWS